VVVLDGPADVAPQALAELADAVRTCLPTDPSRGIAPSREDDRSRSVGEALREIETMLAESDLRSLHAYRRHASLLREVLGKEGEALGELIESYEFERALSHMRRLNARRPEPAASIHGASIPT